MSKDLNEKELSKLSLSDLNNNKKDAEEAEDEEEEVDLTNTSQEIHIEIQNVHPTAEDEEEIPSDEQKDPEMEEFAKNFKKIYETEFHQHLKGLEKNDLLMATSLPTKPYCKDTYEMDAMNATTLNFYFESLECDEEGNINSIVTSTFDRSQKCHFHPHLYKRYGPYQNTTLFTTLYNVGRKGAAEGQAEEFFIDLPVELYNLIDE